MFELPALSSLDIGDGRYEFLSVIKQHQGVMTLTAVDTLQKADVVVRVVPLIGKVRDFGRLRKQLGALPDSNILKYSYTHEFDNHAQFGPSVVLVRRMPLLSLEEYMGDVKAITQTHAMRAMLSSVASGIDDLHSKALIHGNLIPQNIFLVDGSWKLADYSLSLLADQQYVPARLRSNLRFVAPEFLQGTTYSPAGDVYAFGQLCEWLIDNMGVTYVDHEEQLAWDYLIRQMLDANPKRRPAMNTVRDILFDKSKKTMRRAHRLLTARKTRDVISHEISVINGKKLDARNCSAYSSYSTQASEVMSAMLLEFEKHPYRAARMLEGDFLPHYVGILAAATGGKDIARSLESHHNLQLVKDRLNAASSDLSPRMQKRISLGIDSNWLEEIFDQYDEFRRPLDAGLIDEKRIDRMPKELRDAIFPSSARLDRYLRTEIENATRTRAEILTNEDLLTTDEAVAAIDVGRRHINPEILEQLEDDNIIFSLKDHESRLYPSFQFTSDGEVQEAVPFVNDLLQGSSGWARMVWWRRYSAYLGDAPKNVLSDDTTDLIIDALKHSLAIT